MACDLTISKAKAKRKYLLTDKDLEEIEFSEVENPIRKGFTCMKVYSVAEVEQIATQKWGSLEAVAEETERRGNNTKAQSEKRDADMCSNFDKESVFEDMKKYMIGIVLPSVMQSTKEEVTSPYFAPKSRREHVTVIRNGTYEELCECPVIMTFYDCMNREIQEGPSWFIKKKVPDLHREVKKTPFNDRRKLGHFCWVNSNSQSKLVFAVFLTTKWVKHAPGLDIPPFQNVILEVAVKRICEALSDSFSEEVEMSTANQLVLGTYLPRGVDENSFIRVLEQLPIAVKLFCGIRKQKLDT